MKVGHRMNRMHVWGGLGTCLLWLGLASYAAAAPQGGVAKAAVEKDSTCVTCHESTGTVMAIYQTRHGNKADSRTPGCQSCHGESAAHIEDQKNPPDVVFAAKSKKRSAASARNASCLSCHDSAVMPRANWLGSQHETRGIGCSDCHTVHAASQKVLAKATQAEVCYTCHKAQRAQARRISSHPLAATGVATSAAMTCSSCHNPHGSNGPSLLKKTSVNDTCYTCHAEKRGPFLWEHAPVVDNCASCHAPHGSANPTMLKTRAPFLCQECHTGDHASQINSGANLAGGAVTTINGLQAPGAAAPRAQMGGRGCLNCHVLVHGSNHPAGAKFQR